MTKYWPQKRVLNRLLWWINLIVFLKTYNLFVLLIGTEANNYSYTNGITAISLMEYFDEKSTILISTTNSRTSTILAKLSIVDQWSIISTHWPPYIYSSFPIIYNVAKCAPAAHLQQQQRGQCSRLHSTLLHLLQPAPDKQQLNKMYFNENGTCCARWAAQLAALIMMM